MEEMGFKASKFIGRIASGTLKSLPSAIQGYAVGGPAGAALAFAGGASFGGKSPTPMGSPAQYGGVQTGYGNFGGQSYPVVSDSPVAVGNVPNPSASSAVSKIPRAVFDAIVILAGRLGIPLRNVGRIVPVARMILSKLIRFVRLTPGMTLLSMLLSLGLNVDLANQLIVWHATSGKRRRRIRVTNVKALNRSVRRLEGFHRLSQRVEMALASRTTTRTIRRRRCPKCRKSPCTC